ncbi:hypothetical protein [Aerosakkonema funiforme]|uniref:hypothetical protein n=1 Tax=Aerosakkonema funiforme TaxID=1246630 RepID=UPI001F54C9E8|nr:hypothetical protein [Aerosakkonema funiforme]
MIVVSDTSGICYLLLINQIEILQILYKVVAIPQTVGVLSISWRSSSLMVITASQEDWYFEYNESRSESSKGFHWYDRNG